MTERSVTFGRRGKSVRIDKIPAGASPIERKRIQARNRKRKQRGGLIPDRRKAPSAPVSSDDAISATPQITTGSPQGQMTDAFSKKELRRVDPAFYEVLREGIPIIDGAIGRLVSLNGTIRVIGDNMDLVKELEDFCLNIPVNDVQKGIHAFHQNFANETFEQGFSLSEFIATRDRKDMDRLIVADSKRIIFRKNKQGRFEPWYRTGEAKASNYTMPGSVIQQILNTSYGQSVSFNGTEEIRLKPENKMYFSISNENSDPYGVSIMRSLDFVAQTLVTIQNAMKNTAERFGDPIFHAHYKGRANDNKLSERREKLEKDLNSAISAKRAGKSADLVTAGGPDSDVVIKIIGGEGEILDFSIPTRHLLEQIVSKTHLPAWMLGIYWSTTERMATLEIEAALADARIRQFAMLPEFIRLFSAFLRLRGRSWKSVTTSLDKAGDWGIVFESPNLRDLVAQAQANFLNAQAAQMTVQAAPSSLPAKSLHAKSLQVGKLSSLQAACGCRITHHGAVKELNRPTPWPELDKVEGMYETELKDHWAVLQERVFTILGLGDGKGLSGSLMSEKDTEIPSLEAFSFTDEQRAQIMQAYKNWIGTFNISDADSPVLWAYGQAYSLGLIQAVHMISKERPILDILKNREIFDKLTETGFSMVKENATRAIEQVIFPEMEAQMLAGTNPIHVAARLEKLFGDQNSDWERLARSEMSMAAEKAKLDEWKEWDIRQVEFTPAPDGCPICFSLAGDYDIANAPVPVADTHPRCRCSIRPASSEA